MKEGDEEPPEEEHYVWNEGVRSDNEEVSEDDAELDFLFRGSINRDSFSQTDDDERTTESDGIIAFEPFSVNATDADSDREYSFFGQSVRTIFSTYAAWRAGRQKQKLRDVSKFLVLERIANHLANERTLLVSTPFFLPFLILYETSQLGVDKSGAYDCSCRDRAVRFS